MPQSLTPESDTSTVTCYDRFHFRFVPVKVQHWTGLERKNLSAIGKNSVTVMKTGTDGGK